ncbi:MAG: vitamin B12-dependent ribonucleotide reductase, partial [Candidatus Micrarchaeia archaeon]|jgi:ribonucleoside-diphosphate reductase alpha chain
MAFNSPVWFNVGVEEKPQCSACFINSVEDNMKSILGLAVTEGMLFKFGSGTGTNLSPLRSSKEHVKGGGKASGPVSFMKGYDAFAGVIKSGGKTRRAAKMQILNIDHPDVEEFINCKWKEEKKAWTLMDAGYGGEIGGEAYDSVFFQNANLSVRVTDEFMHAIEQDKEFSTRFVSNGEVCKTYKARELMNMVAEAAWMCGDPGIQFDTVVNNWNPVIVSGRINSSNPCSEYMFLDNSACNLASLNLLKFADENGELNVEQFKHAVEVTATAMEIIVGFSSYPTELIAQNSFDYRPLGLGYANVGALLMLRGVPYDSEEGRNYVAAVTALLSGQGYRTSAIISKRLGPFKYYRLNEQPFLRVIGMHRDHAYKIEKKGVPGELLEAAKVSWDECQALGKEHGYKNGQISVIAPTGTIAFMMDCDTTGIEPDIALVKYKWMVGGGMMKIVNGTVPAALARLGYSKKHVEEILAHIDQHDTIEGAPHLKAEHLPVFDCAFKPAKGTRSIHYMGHVRMMAAAQPFISGAISKTVNMPNDVTAEDIASVYVSAWRMGLKAIAIYRDGSKRQQALTTSRGGEKKEERVVYTPVRRRLPDERNAMTHKFSIAGHEGYLTVGLYEDGSPGEIFIVMAKQGSTLSGMMDAFATSVSMALQYGVPLKALVGKFVHMRFEPSGVTTNAQIRIAKSIVDYIFRWMALKFMPPDELAAIGLNEVHGEENGNGLKKPEGKAVPKMDLKDNEKSSFQPAASASAPITFDAQADSPSCPSCGSLMVRAGTCYKCLNCGETSGCG